MGVVVDVTVEGAQCLAEFGGARAPVILSASWSADGERIMSTSTSRASPSSSGSPAMWLAATGALGPDWALLGGGDHYRVLLSLA